MSVVRYRLRRNADGQVRDGTSEWDPANGCPVFIWTEGNYGCDCNRSIFWHEADGMSNREAYAIERPCGTEAYDLLGLWLDGVALDVDAP